MLTFCRAWCRRSTSADLSRPGETRVPTFASVENLVGRVGPEALKAGDEELPQRAGVALFEHFAQRFPRHAMRRRPAAVGQSDLDLEGVAAIDGRRPRGGHVKLARHHLPQALEDQLLADRRDAIGGRGRNLRLLNGLIEQVGLVAADLLGVGPGADLRRRAKPPATPGLTRENEWTRNCAIVGALVSLQHRHQPAQLHAVRVRLDLFWLGRKLIRHPRVVFLVPVGIGVMDRHVRVGDGGLFEIIVDAAAAALVASPPARS